MNVIGFNFTNLVAEKSSEFRGAYSINTDITFSNIESTDISLLKDSSALKVGYKYKVEYISNETKDKKIADISIEGNLLLTAPKEDADKVLESWKKKELPPSFKVALFNVILRRCTVKALNLETDLELPYHMPLPSLRVGKKDAEGKSEDKK